MIRLLMLIVLALLITGCTVHPAGEKALRASAAEEGKAFNRKIPDLSTDASLDEIVNYALLSNAELEQRFWEWKAAIEQIPQSGTQPANFVLFAGVPIAHGSTAFDRTTVTVSNDPMNDIVWPAKLSVAAERSLEDAKAAGLQFQKAKYDLRNKVIDAYVDYALTAELIRLEQSNNELLKTIASATEARNRAGSAEQEDVLKAKNEADLCTNDIAQMQSKLLSERATLNALLGRTPSAALKVPTTIPSTPPGVHADDELLAIAAQRNPELNALAHDIQSKKESIHLAQLQYTPDFSISAAANLADVVQNLSGMITVPILRHEAIDAAISQADANLRAAQAMQCQKTNDVESEVISDITTFRDANRQLELFKNTILPRAEQVVTFTRTDYESGHASLIDLLDSQRFLISTKRLIVNLKASRQKHLANLETLVDSAEITIKSP